MPIPVGCAISAVARGDDDRLSILAERAGGWDIRYDCETAVTGGIPKAAIGEVML